MQNRERTVLGRRRDTEQRIHEPCVYLWVLCSYRLQPIFGWISFALFVSDAYWQWHLPNACQPFFICASKTDLIFVFRFSSLLKTNLICDFRFSFLHGLLLENWFEVRMSFLRDCENRINASVIWNSRSPHRGWSRYCGAFQFIISPFLLPGRLPGTWNSNLLFNNKPRKHENQLRFSKLMPKRKTKSKSVLVLDSTHSTPRLPCRIDYLDYRSWHSFLLHIRHIQTQGPG